VLGLRLVKKTVNFDNHHVYHFYYGDESGTPGTIWTTFPTRARRSGRLRAPDRLASRRSRSPQGPSTVGAPGREHGISVKDVESRFGEESISFSDPSARVRAGGERPGRPDA
jgi:glyoxalase family protein